MAVLDNFFIKVNTSDKYSTDGTFKSLRELHTLNGQLYPQEDLSRYYHPVISEFGDNPNAFKQVYSTSATNFVNTTEGIEFPNDLLADAVDPVLSGKLYKANVDYPLMNPYMVKLLDYYATPRERRIISSGTYPFNQWGCTTNANIQNTGIIELQGGGGGSGGTNNSGDDSGGGGGGAGAFAAVYYRIKKTNNPSATCLMIISTGARGTAGASGSGVGGTGGTTHLTFTSHSGSSCYVYAQGGFGGTGGNYNYTPGGAGGNLVIQPAGGSSITLATGGVGGSESQDTAGNGEVAGTLSTSWKDTTYTLIDDDYLTVIVLKAKGGAGGGRGDDTGGKFQAKPGGNSFATTDITTKKAYLQTVPYSCGSDNNIYYTPKAGGTAIESYSGAGGGGGGASVFDVGGASGASSSIGSAGSLGSGAGGSGIGGNANRAGAAGGAGVAYIYI